MTEEYDRLHDESRVNEKTGLPIMEEAQVEKAKAMNAYFPFIFTIIFFSIGYGIAYAIYALGDTTTYQARINLAKEYDG